MSSILVTSRPNPDLDGFACTLAYAEFLQHAGQNAVPGIFGNVNAETQFVLDFLQMDEPPQAEDPSTYDQIVFVDASDVKGWNSDFPVQNVAEVIDHRTVHEAHLFPNAKIEIELIGAAATLIARRFYRQKLPLSRTSAMLLYAAIISNTLNFRAKVTTEWDHAMALWLEEQVRPPKDFAQRMFAAKSNVEGDKLFQRLDAEFGSYELGGKQVGIAQTEMIGGEELLANRLEEALGYLTQLRETRKVDMIFWSLVELEKGCNFFVTTDPALQKILSQALGIVFENNVAIRPSLIMRKELVPLLKHFEEHNKALAQENSNSQ